MSDFTPYPWEIMDLNVLGKHGKTERICYKPSFINDRNACPLNKETSIKINSLNTTFTYVWLFMFYVQYNRKTSTYCMLQKIHRDKFGDTVNQRRTDNTMTNRKRLNDKQRSTKHYTENKRSSNTNPTKTQGQLRCYWWHV